jgi:ATP-dependent Clp protease protease subunit
MPNPNKHKVSGDLAALLEAMEFEIPDRSLPEPEMMAYWKLSNQRQFYIDADIDVSILSIQREILLINEADNGIPKENRKPIMLYICSYGGDIDYMYSLIDTILLSVTPVCTVNMGVAASAASLIFMSGHKRFMMPRSKVMIHEGSAGINGDANKVMDAADDYRRVIKDMKDFILAHTKIPKNVLMKKRSNDWTLTAPECLNYGICDRVVESLDEVI